MFRCDPGSPERLYCACFGPTRRGCVACMAADAATALALPNLSLAALSISKFGFTPEQMENIRHGNAQDLFPRLRA